MIEWKGNIDNKSGVGIFDGFEIQLSSFEDYLTIANSISDAYRDGVEIGRLNCKSVIENALKSLGGEL